MTRRIGTARLTEQIEGPRPGRCAVKRTDFQKAAVAVIDAKVYPDTRTCRADGSIEVKRSYFYRHGMTADGFAAGIQAELSKAGIAAVVTGQDKWASWPRTSWFVATVKAGAL